MYSKKYFLTHSHLFDRVENIVGKGENAVINNQHFLLFP